MKRKRLFNTQFMLVGLLILSIIISPIISEARVNTKQHSEVEYLDEISIYINQYFKESKIPGMSVVICDENEMLFNKQYGYVDLDNKKEVTQDTYFELGSNSKAFTGLAIRKLELEGKINLSDNIEKYVNLKMKYENDYQELKISDFLFHTSGIPFKSIGLIPTGEEEDALKNTVDSLASQTLDRSPGTEFSYATINYDVLGYVITQVSGMSYEQYMLKHIFKPLGLTNTGFLYLKSSGMEASGLDVASGYKLFYLKAKEFKSPVYRGNAPAGYIAMNSVDLAKWMQLNMSDSPLITPDWKQIIRTTHEADRSVAPDSDDTSYASGWKTYQSGSGKIAHGGNNANYSSYIIIRTGDNIAVGILANLNSEYTTLIANGIMDIIEDKESAYIYRDQYKVVNMVAIVISIICIGIMTIAVILSTYVIWDVIKKRRHAVTGIIAIGRQFGMILLVLTATGYCVYLLPDVLYSQLPWKFVLEWAPFSLKPTMVMLGISMALFSAYCLLASVFPKKNDTFIFLLTILSLSSGLGNSIIIFTVNEALVRDDFSYAIFVYCMFGMFLYVFGQKFVRSKLIKLTNQYVLELRVRLVEQILNSGYRQFESLDTGNINNVVNGDIEILSNSPTMIVGGITNLGTLLCCFFYLAILDVRAMALSIVIIAFAVFIYLFIGRENNRLWKETRELQDGFYNYINDIILGFKQLKLSVAKRFQFIGDIEINTKKYTNKNTEAAINYVNVFIIGELVFTLVIVSAAFLFPIVFTNIHKNILSAYVFAFLFMAGPLSGVMNSVPQFMKTKISYNRIKDFENRIVIEEIREPLQEQLPTDINLRINNVQYSYNDNESNSFSIGPIHCEFNSGEINFITGGNGSGKTTLLKLLCGLYEPTAGEILLNGKTAGGFIREHFANVFSDYHLFERLYGVEYKGKEAVVHEMLKLLEIEDKLSVENGRLSTLNLSTGQRKRVALMICCLEDKPICIFDEWAADQDPQFRKFFYEEILFDLKRKGKCVIAITHDDRYFHLADKILKMEFGMLVEYKKK